MTDNNYDAIELRPPSIPRERFPDPSDQGERVGARNRSSGGEKRSIANSRSIAGIQQFLTVATIVGFLVGAALLGLAIGGYFFGSNNPDSCAGLCTDGKDGINGINATTAVTGPGNGSATVGDLPAFNNTNGTQLVDSGIPAANVVRNYNSSAANGSLPMFNGTTGKIIDDSGIPVGQVVTNPGGASAPGNVAVFNTTSGKIIFDSNRTLPFSGAAELSSANQTAGVIVYVQTAVSFTTVTAASPAGEKFTSGSNPAGLWSRPSPGTLAFTGQTANLVFCSFYATFFCSSSTTAPFRLKWMGAVMAFANVPVLAGGAGTVSLQKLLTMTGGGSTDAMSVDVATSGGAPPLSNFVYSFNCAIQY